MADWQTLSDRINHVAPSATLAVDSKAKAMKAAGIDVIGFGAGEPNFPTPAPIVAAAAAAVQDPKNYRYTPTAGLPELRQAIADKTLRDSGYEVDPSQVIVTNGGKQAVYESFQILLNEGDEVIIPTPYWTSYPEAVKLAGGVPVTVFAGADRNFEPSIEEVLDAILQRFIEGDEPVLKEEFYKVDYKDIVIKKGENPDGSEDELMYPRELVLMSENEKEKDKRLVPAKLRDIDRKGGKPGTGGKVIALVKNTFHPDTLKNWYDIEERQDVRLEIFKQKEGVDNGTIKG